VQAVAAALLTRDLSAERPVAILSGNAIDHLMLALGPMHVGIPHCAISVPYSRVSQVSWCVSFAGNSPSQQFRCSG